MRSKLQKQIKIIKTRDDREFEKQIKEAALETRTSQLKEQEIKTEKIKKFIKKLKTRTGPATKQDVKSSIRRIYRSNITEGFSLGEQRYPQKQKQFHAKTRKIREKTNNCIDI